MKTKLLSAIRKHYDYKFLSNGKLAVKNKTTGTVKEYNSIEDYIGGLSVSDTFISHLSSHKWNKKKQTIKDSLRKRDETYWNSIN
jgi:hypothetical protein